MGPTYPIKVIIAKYFHIVNHLFDIFIDIINQMVYNNKCKEEVREWKT